MFIILIYTNYPRNLVLMILFATSAPVRQLTEEIAFALPIRVLSQWLGLRYILQVRKNG